MVTHELAISDIHPHETQGCTLWTLSGAKRVSTNGIYLELNSIDSPIHVIHGRVTLL